jgi:IS4 transposase
MLPIRTSEREIAVEHLNYLHGLKPDHNLVLLDRGYPSMELIRQFDDHQIFYLMRCNKREFIREIREARETDKVLELKRQLPKTKEEMHTVMRVVQFPLENGTVETLITNLVDNSLSVEDFKYLYHLRWGIEEKYDELKNKLKIEAFSGMTPIAVLQDFYATMFLTNL